MTIDTHAHTNIRLKEITLSSSERFLILTRIVIANHFLGIGAVCAAAEGAGENHTDQAGCASEFLGLEEVSLVAAGAVELILILVDDDSGALRLGRRLHIHGLLHHHNWLLDHHRLHVHL